MKKIAKKNEDTENNPNKVNDQNLSRKEGDT